MPYKSHLKKLQNAREYREKNKDLLARKRKINYWSYRKILLPIKRKWYQNHKEAINKRRRKKYLKNRDKIIARVKKYYSRNKEKVRKTQRKWVKKNRKRILELYKINHKKWYQKNKKKRRQQIKEYRKQNPEMGWAATHKHINRKRHFGGSFTAQEWKEIKQKQKNLCKACKKKKKLTIDHKIPSKKWAMWRKANKPKYKYNDIQNIQGLCLPCNSSKSDKLKI